MCLRGGCHTRRERAGAGGHRRGHVPPPATGEALVKVRQGVAALAILALSLPGLRASAQTEPSDQQPEEKTNPEAPVEPTAPAERMARPKLPPAPEADAGPYVPFAPPP